MVCSNVSLPQIIRIHQSSINVQAIDAIARASSPLRLAIARTPETGRVSDETTGGDRVGSARPGPVRSRSGNRGRRLVGPMATDLPGADHRARWGRLPVRGVSRARHAERAVPLP